MAGDGKSGDGRRSEHVALLLSEKEHADRQIGSYLELQLKMMAFLFSALVVAAGLGLGGGSKAGITPSQTGVTLLIVVFIGIFAILQSVIMYGIVLGYIRYKQMVIGRSLKEVLGLTANPLQALPTISRASSNTVVLGASFLLGGGITAGTVILLVAALRSALQAASPALIAGVSACALLLLGAVACFIALIRAMAQLARDIQLAADP